MQPDKHILHITIDDKFIEHAYPVFEEAYPNKNLVWVVKNKLPLQLMRHTPDKIFSSRESKFNFDNVSIIIFHSLHADLEKVFKAIPKHIPIAWVGWGYDYYDLIAKPKDLLLSQTQHLKQSLTSFVNLKAFAKFCLSKLKLQSKVSLHDKNKFKVNALTRINYFCPVLPPEHSIILEKLNLTQFPTLGYWNYGTLEDNFVKGFEDKWVTGCDILIGNSATYTSNHLEAFELISKLETSHSKRIIVPLSYGAAGIKYVDHIAKIGNKLFGDRFIGMREFLKPEEYVENLVSCGFVILNHIRQQAVGNVVIMLYLGARLFLREENPVYLALKNSGVFVNSIQELEDNPALLNTPLSNSEREHNRSIMIKDWSRKRALEKTKTLVENLLKVEA